MLPLRLCISAILAGKKPAALPAATDELLSQSAPPPPKKEAAPSARDGVVWSPGYWKFVNTWFVWCAGHWELSRPGQIYMPPRWERYADGWHFQPGAWREDGSAGQASVKRNVSDAPDYDALGAFR